MEGVDYHFLGGAIEMADPGAEGDDGRGVFRAILFTVFVVLFVLIVAGTLATIFLGYGKLTPTERNVLFGSFVVEIGAAIVALFYFLFGMNRSGDRGGRIRLQYEDVKALIGKEASVTPYQSSGKSLQESRCRILNDNGPFITFQWPTQTHVVHIQVNDNGKSYTGSFTVGTYLVDMQ
jgi:hypothetical protein